MILTKENIESIDLDGLIDRQIRAGEINELLIIVPTNRKLRYLKKEIISKSPGGTVSQINLETLSTLSEKLLYEEKNFKELSEASATVLIKQSASELKLKYFKNYNGKIPHGTLDRIKNVISEYKKHGITPELLRGEAEKLDLSERLKAEDIADIYELFKMKCDDLNALETGDIYEEICAIDVQNFEKYFFTQFPGVKFIIVNGFDEFTNPEVKIINSLSNLSKIKFYLNFDYFSYNSMIFSHLEKCYSKLEGKSFKKIKDESPSAEDKFQSLIKEELFLSKNKKRSNLYKNKIVKINSPDREKEIELIAKEIKKLITGEKVEPHEICLAFNLIQDYSSIVRDIFTKYKLPFNLTDRIPLDNSFPVIAVVNFLEILESDYYYKNIFRALNSGFVDTLDIDLVNLSNVAAKLKIVVGKERWIYTIKDVLGGLKFGEVSEYENLEFLKKSYEKAIEDIGKIEAKLKDFEGKFSPDEFIEKLRKFIVGLNIPAILLEKAYGKEEENIKGITTFLETMTEIFELLSEEYGSKKFPLKFYLDQIRTACGWARFNVKEKSDYGIQITTVNEIRGLRFDYLFIAGLVDGNFPTRFNPEIFFSGSFAKQEIVHQTEERYHFYQALCSWKKKLYLSSPATDEKKELTESNFLKDFSEVFEFGSIDERDYAENIFSTEELLNLIGREGVENFKKNKIKFAGNHKIDLEYLDKAIRVDKIRTDDPFADSIYCGNLKGGKKFESGENVISAKSSSLLNMFKKKQYSISQLETYAKCPFKFFVERVLKLQQFEEPTEEVEAREMGSILHSIFYEFYNKLREIDLNLQNCSDLNFEKAEEILFKTAEEIIEKAGFNSDVTFYEREKIFGINGNRNDSILYKFLENERAEEDNFLPKFFEVSFGSANTVEADKVLSTSGPIEIDGVKLKGKIDRIEINDNTNEFNIVDYKLSGRKPTKDELWDGISLQLPVYLFAAEKLIYNKLERVCRPNNMYIYSLKYQQGSLRKLNVKPSQKKKTDPEETKNLIESTLENIKNYVSDIAGGKFNLTQLENREQKVCNFCDFKPVCRIQEVS